MRENKYMAWDENEKQMLTWEELQEDWESEGYYGSVFRADHWTPLQYIGRRDSKRTVEFPNGQEIYEGHIIYENQYFHSNYQVVYDEENCRFIGVKIGDRDGNILEFPQLSDFGVIVGDIFRNPELLK